MKRGMTVREKVMLGLLGILCIICVYNYLFYQPIKEDIARYKEEYIEQDDVLIMLEAKGAKFAQMKSEIDAIKSGSTEGIKEIPKYDNRQNLMMQLSSILSKTENYNLRFGSVTSEGNVISRQIILDYTCNGYMAAKSILQEIYNGEYPCVIGNVHISDEGATSLYITYYEYGKLEE